MATTETMGPPRHRGEVNAMSNEALRYEGVSKSFGDGPRSVQALDRVDLVVERGEFLVLFGPSGCGKSTLLNMAAGLMRPTTGRVLRDGELVRDVSSKVGYLTQHDTLLPWRTAERNVSLGLEIQKVARRERAQRVQEALDLVGLNGFERHYMRQLSGGMRKRVALARTLICDPPIILMDEPYGALDAQLRMALQEQLLKVWRQRQLTIVFVTHDLGEAIALADRIVVFSPRPGRIKRIVEVAIPRPRELTRINMHPEYLRIYEQLWSELSHGEDPSEVEVG